MLVIYVSNFPGLTRRLSLTVIEGTFRMFGQAQPVAGGRVCLSVGMRTNTGRTGPLGVTAR